MGYTVLHSEKGTSGSGGIGNHIDRTKGQEHSFEHVDKDMSYKNMNAHLPDDKHKMDLTTAINFRIEQGYNGKRKIRTDAVKFNTHILSGSHKDMMEIFKDKESSNSWIKDNLEFVKKEFGEKNIVRFSVHLDEKTPHIHVVTVPLTEDGRLSSKEVLGNKTTLTKRQDRYAEAMGKYGLMRGKKGTGIKHEGVKAYYARMNEAIAPQKDLTVKNTFLGADLGVNKDKTIESLKNALDAQTTFSISLKADNDILKSQNEKIKGRADTAMKNFIMAISSEKAFNQLHDKRIELLKKHINIEVSRKILFASGLNKMDRKEENNFLNETVKKVVREYDVPDDTATKIYQDLDFKASFREKFQERAEREEKQERGRNEGRSRGGR